MNAVTNPEVFYPVGSKWILDPGDKKENWIKNGYGDWIGSEIEVTGQDKDVMDKFIVRAKNQAGQILWVYPEMLKPLKYSIQSDEYDPMKQLEIAKQKRDANLREVFGF